MLETDLKVMFLYPPDLVCVLKQPHPDTSPTESLSQPVQILPLSSGPQACSGILVKTGQSSSTMYLMKELMSRLHTDFLTEEIRMASNWEQMVLPTRLTKVHVGKCAKEDLH